jgi:hypothetical protein
MTATADELEPIGAFELGVELRFVELELERIATGLLVVGDRRAAHGCLADARTLELVLARLENGQTTAELAGLFLAAGRTLTERRLVELEAARA